MRLLDKDEACGGSIKWLRVQIVQGGWGVAPAGGGVWERDVVRDCCCEKKASAEETHKLVGVEKTGGGGKRESRRRRAQGASGL